MCLWKWFVAYVTGKPLCFCQKETDISVHNIDEINAHFVLFNVFLANQLFC